MRNIKRFLPGLIRAVCFGLIFVLLCGLCGTYLARPTEFDVILDTFYELPRDSVTTLFVGTSVPYDAYWADVYDEAAGGYCYSLCSAGQSVTGSYYVLREAFKTQSPQVVVLDANWCLMSVVGDDRDAPTNAVSDLTILDAMRLSANKLDYIFRALPSENWIDAAFPFYRYRSDYDMKLLEVNFNKRVYNAGTAYTERGFKHYADPSPEELAALLDVYEWRGMRPEALAQLARVVALCREHGALPLILVPPLSYPALAVLTNYQDYLDAMEAFAAEQGVLFMDFSLTREEKLARPDSGFYDSCHLAGKSISVPYTRLVAEVVGKAVSDTLDRAEYLHPSYQALMDAQSATR